MRRMKVDLPQPAERRDINMQTLHVQIINRWMLGAR